MKLRLTKRRQIASGLLGVTLVFGLLLIVANQKAGKNVNLLADASQNSNQTDVLGASYQSKGYSLVVNKVKAYPVNETTYDQRIVVELSLTNTSSSDLLFSPGLQLSIQDNNGAVHMATARYMAAGQVIGGPISSGQVSKTDVDFDIPAGSQPVKVIFQQDAGSPATIIKL